MDSTPNNTPVNKYYFGSDVASVTKPTKDTVGKEANYIIIQNDALHSKVETLQARVNELEHTNEELEDENGSLETSKTSLKGYISNMASFNQHSKDLVNIYHQNILKIPKVHKELVWDLKRFGGAYVVFVIGYIFMQFFLATSWTSALKSIIGSLVLLGPVIPIGWQSVVQYKSLIEIKDLSKNAEVTRLRNELRKAMKGNDYLSDLVDRL